MRKAIFAVLCWASFAAMAAPGSYSGNTEYEGNGGSSDGWSVAFALIGLPLALLIFSLACGGPRSDRNWWTKMDETGRGVHLMFGICAVPLVLMLFEKLFG